MKKGIILVIVFLVVGLLAFFAVKMSQKEHDGSLRMVSDFSLKDTAAINMLILTNTEADTTILERQDDGFWMVNGQFRVQQQPLNTILNTIRNIRVKSEVNEKINENLLRQMVARHSKVQIYQNSKLVKTYWVGNPTKDNYGTYMLLETPENGRSSNIFVMELPGHKGHLATRFFADVVDWRFSGVFNYAMKDLKEVSVTNFEKPEESYTVQINGRELSLLDGKGTPVPDMDTGRVANYLPVYKKIHYNFFEENLTAEQIDSVKQSTPMFTIKVTDIKGKTNTVTCHKRYAYKGTMDEEGNERKYDVDRFIGILNDGKAVVCQYFVFDPLFRPLSSFKKSNR